MAVPPAALAGAGAGVDVTYDPLALLAGLEEIDSATNAPVAPEEAPTRRTGVFDLVAMNSTFGSAVFRTNAALSAGAPDMVAKAIREARKDVSGMIGRHSTGGSDAPQFITAIVIAALKAKYPHIRDFLTDDVLDNVVQLADAGQNA